MASPTPSGELYAMKHLPQELCRRLWRRPWRHRLGLRPGVDEGYTLVALVVMFTVMNILVAMALPLWSGVIQRDKEHEFIFRGLQYAEAIRVYQQRYGQWPQKLEELAEDKGRGRCIRQLWTNPLADGGKWDPVFEGVPNANQQQQDNGLGNSKENRNRPDGDDSPRGPLGQKLTGSDEIRVGPIIGVGSKEKPEIVERNIPQWNFTIRLLQTRAIGTGQANPNRNLPINAEVIGLPLPGSPAGGDAGAAGGTNLGGSVGGAQAIGGGGGSAPPSGSKG